METGLEGMIKRIYNIFWLLLLSFFVSHSYAQQIQLERLDLEDGLSQSSVTAIDQDEKGFLWIGTADGLNRYDGRHFHVFKNRPFDVSSLSGNHINDLAVQSKFGIWIATYNGLNLYDPTENVFHRFLQNEESNQSISNNLITTLLPEGDSVLWVGTSNGLNRLSIKEQESDRPKLSIQHFLVDQSKIRRSGLSPHYIRTIYRDSQNRLWVGTTKGLYLFDLKTDPQGTNPKYFGADKDQAGALSSWQVTSISEDGQSRIWVGTYSGINRFVDSEAGFLNPSDLIENYQPDQYFEVMNLDYQSDQNFLITMYQGLFKAELLSNGKLRLEKLHSNDDDLSTRAFISSATDQLNPEISWLGTEASGLLKMHRKPLRFQSNNLSDARPEGLLSPSIFGLIKDNQERVWMGTHNGLLVMDQKDQSYQFIASNRKDPTKLRSTRASDLYIDQSDQIWVATSVGLHKLDQYKNGEATFNYFGPSREVEDRAALCIYEFPDGQFVYGSYTGIGILDPKKDQQQGPPIIIDTLGLTLRGYRVNSIQRDERNDLWVGSSNGLYRLQNIENPKTDIAKAAIETFRYNERDTNSLRNDFITSIYLDAKDRLWAGTFNGLIRIIRNGNQVRFKSYSEEQGLGNNVVYEILEDHDTGHLWLSTNRGLSRFDPERESFWVFTSSDGLQSNEFNLNAAFADAKGRFYFGGVNGLTTFHPNQIKPEQQVPKVHFKHLKTGTGKIIDLMYEEHETIQLLPGQSNFEVHFLAFDYAATNRISYAYTLDRKDPVWIDLGSDQKIQFTRLSPGLHQLRLRAANHDGVWSKEYATIDLHVLAPFWKTPWFWGLIVLAMGVGALVFHRLRWQMKIKKLEEIEAFRKATAEDFHDELGSKLTIISLFSEITRDKLNGQSHIVKPYLEKVIETSNSLYHSMKDLIWALNPEQDTIYDLALQIKDFGDELFHETGIEFSTEGFNQSIVHQEIPMAYKRHILLVFKEAMNNILKHSDCQHVTMSLNHGNKSLKIQVMDDGKGFECEAELCGDGLKNMASRADRIDGKLMVDSAPGKGTRVLLECPLLN